jgi:hypothetical protein
MQNEAENRSNSAMRMQLQQMQAELQLVRQRAGTPIQVAYEMQLSLHQLQQMQAELHLVRLCEGTRM